MPSFHYSLGHEVLSKMYHNIEIIPILLSIQWVVKKVAIYKFVVSAGKNSPSNTNEKNIGEAPIFGCIGK